MQPNNSKSHGSSYTTLFREYYPEICRWRSPDPNLKDFPSESPFSAMGNNSIMKIDLLGDNYGVEVNHDTKTIIVKTNYIESHFNIFTSTLEESIVKVNSLSCKFAYTFNDALGNEISYDILFQVNNIGKENGDKVERKFF